MYGVITTTDHANQGQKSSAQRKSLKEKKVSAVTHSDSATPLRTTAPKSDILIPVETASLVVVLEGLAEGDVVVEADPAGFDALVAILLGVDACGAAAAGAAEDEVEVESEVVSFTEAIACC